MPFPPALLEDIATLISRAAGEIKREAERDRESFQNEVKTTLAELRASVAEHRLALTELTQKSAGELNATAIAQAEKVNAATTKMVEAASDAVEAAIKAVPVVDVAAMVAEAVTKATAAAQASAAEVSNEIAGSMKDTVVGFVHAAEEKAAALATEIKDAIESIPTIEAVTTIAAKEAGEVALARVATEIESIRSHTTSIGDSVKEAVEAAGKGLTEDQVRKALDVGFETATVAAAAKIQAAAEEAKATVETAVKAAVAALPPAEPGKSVTPDEVLPVLREHMQAEIDGFMEAFDKVIGEKLQEGTASAVKAAADAVAALPRAKDGESVTVDDVLPAVLPNLQADLAEALTDMKATLATDIENLRASMRAAAENIAKAVADDAVAALPDRIKADLTPVLAVSVAELVGKVAEGIVVPVAPTVEDLQPTIRQAATEAVAALRVPGAQDLIDAIMEGLPAIPTKGDLLPDLLGTLGNELHAEIKDAIGDLAKAQAAADEAVAKAASTTAGLVEQAEAAVDSLVKGMPAAAAEAVNALRSDVDAQITRQVTETAAALEKKAEGLAAQVLDLLPRQVDDAVVIATKGLEPAAKEAAEAAAVAEVGKLQDRLLKTAEEFRAKDDAHAAKVTEALEALPALAESLVADAVKAIPAPLPAEPVDPAPMVAKAVEDALAERVQKYEQAITSVVETAVAKAPVPKDFVLDREGHLVGVMPDGTIKDFGLVCGKDGVSVKPEEVLAMVKEAVAALPKAEDGKDGIEVKDIDSELRDEGWFIIFRRPDGTVAKELRAPVQIYRDIWEKGRTYFKGDQVTHGGSQWTVMVDKTAGQPGHDPAWKLTVKKGADQKTVVVTPRDPKEPVKVAPPKVD